MSKGFLIKTYVLLIVYFAFVNYVVATKRQSFNPIEIDDGYYNSSYESNTEGDTELFNSSLSGKEKLGRATWAFLHTLAGMYPAEPDPKYQEYIRLFINLLPYIYPCEECAVGMRAFFDLYPPETTSMEQFGGWLCMIHNLVNEKLGKPQYDCSKWMDQWRPDDCTSCHLSDTTTTDATKLQPVNHIAKRKKFKKPSAPVIVTVQ